MNLTHRKIAIATVVALTIVLANMNEIVSWLQELGVLPLAEHIRSEYLTGTAIAVIVALLVLLPSRSALAMLIRRCSVCDTVLLRRGTYCAECGSKV